MDIDYEYDFHKNHELILSKVNYKNKGLTGVVNLGNTCFMNSIIACLSNTLKLTDYFLSNEYKKDDPEYTNKRKQEFTVLTSYINLLINIWETNQVLKPKSFVENMSKLIPKYGKFQQQDSHEFLMYTLDILHKALSYEIDVEIKGEEKNEYDTLVKKSLETWKVFYEKNYSYINEIFNGMFHNRIECSNCKVTDNIFEPFNSISLDVPIAPSVDINECLENYFLKSEKIETWKCEKCNEQGCEKSCKFWSVPNYVIIHLKRFTNTGKKIDTLVNFPKEDLDLTNYISPNKQNQNNYIYSLYSINYHSGSMNGGHYWSSCKNLNDNWHIYNDGHVSKFTSDEEISEKNAYILFYYRKMIPSTV